MDTVRRVRNLGRVGIAELFWRTTRQLFRRESVLIMALALDDGWRRRAPGVPRRDDLMFQWLDERSLEVLCEPQLGYEDPDVFERSLGRLDRGDRCLAGFVAGQPVTYLWLTNGMRRVVHSEIKLGDGQVWIYKSYTHPAWRRQGLTQLLGRHALLCAADEGNEVALVDMVETNRPSVAAFRGIGFTKLGRFLARSVPDGLQGEVPTRLLDRVAALPEEPRKPGPIDGRPTG
jgi:GNAT superfamily N-acetyltransferase